MNNFANDFENFLNTRYEKAIKNLEKNEYYQKNINEFSKLENNISNNLSEDNQIYLENLIDCFYDMQTEQISLAYKLGIKDCLDFQNLIKG